MRFCIGLTIALLGLKAVHSLNFSQEQEHDRKSSWPSLATIKIESVEIYDVNGYDWKCAFTKPYDGDFNPDLFRGNIFKIKAPKKENRHLSIKPTRKVNVDIMVESLPVQDARLVLTCKAHNSRYADWEKFGEVRLSPGALNEESGVTSEKINLAAGRLTIKWKAVHFLNFNQEQEHDRKSPSPSFADISIESVEIDDDIGYGWKCAITKPYDGDFNPDLFHEHIFKIEAPKKEYRHLSIKPTRKVNVDVIVESLPIQNARLVLTCKAHNSRYDHWEKFGEVRLSPGALNYESEVNSENINLAAGRLTIEWQVFLLS